MTQADKAVCLRGITKLYGRRKKVRVVLDNLDMDVDKGTIYGLLGASGCGKTTLLTCMVGRRSVSSGDVWVLGGRPGSRRSGVPGPRLGFMPQEIALVRQFTIRDALLHFAWIYEMDAERIRERMEFLARLLELPDMDSRIEHLSGGQQRRVSLAVALIHDPELVILDEPTVGLDPVLRQTIWDHLLELATKHNKTIIITTHYIEEARQAHKIGLMRNGKLLAEGSPDNLLRTYNCASVEDLFLYLSARQDKASGSDPRALPESDASIGERDAAEDGSDGEKDLDRKCGAVRRRLEKAWSDAKFTNRGHIKALMSKNWYRIIRHPGAILFIFLFPMLELCSFYLSVGGRPQGLRVGVVNEELRNYSTCAEYVATLDHYGGRDGFEDGDPHCTLRGLSCKFLEKLSDEVAIKVSYPDLESAVRDAKKGDLISVIHFGRNFSAEFEFRVHPVKNATTEALVGGEISVSLDKSRYQSSIILEQKLRSIHDEFLNQTFAECGVEPKIGTVPLRFEEPVFGTWHSGYRQFMTPGVVTTMIFFLAVSITSTIIVVERLDGVWDRTLLAGVSSTEILLSHIVLESGVILMQVFEVILFVFFIFRMPCHGSFANIVLLLALQGFCGMCGGFLLSVSCNSVTSSNFISMGSFYPMLILSGLMWPIEGMPDSLQTISWTLPTTQGSLALRNIMEKGWGVDHIYNSYLVSLLWIVIFCACSLVIVRIRK